MSLSVVEPHHNLRLISLKAVERGGMNPTVSPKTEFKSLRLR